MADKGAREANAELRHNELVAATRDARASRDEIDRLRAALAASIALTAATIEDLRKARAALAASLEQKDADVLTAARKAHNLQQIDIDRLHDELACYEQTSGDLCPACGWRGIRGDDGCAFCSFDAKGQPAGAEVLRLRHACLREQENTADVEKHLAECEREREEAADDAESMRAHMRVVQTHADSDRSKASVNGARATVAERDLATARAEAERLRGVLRDVVGHLALARLHAYEEHPEVSKADEIARSAALSPASPAVPSSAAPSSEYRRRYERAVEACIEEVRDCEEPSRKEILSAIRSLLPAPREVTEAEVERLTEAAFHGWQATLPVPQAMRWCILGDDMQDRWRASIRAVLAAQGEGRTK